MHALARVNGCGYCAAQSGTKERRFGTSMRDVDSAVSTCRSTRWLTCLHYNQLALLKRHHRNTSIASMTPIQIG